MAALGLTASAQKDTTVVLTQAGTLADQFPNDSLMQTYTGLTLSGPLNGDDIVKLRSICGAGIAGYSVQGNVKTLDLTNATIVEGGAAYTSITTGVEERDAYTENNTIGDFMFATCYQLTTITLPANITKIGITPFAFSYNLTNIIVPESNEYYSTLDGVLFDKAQQTLLVYPEGKYDGTYVMPSTVKTIEYGAFQDAYGLSHVTLSPVLTHIGPLAFSQTTLSEIEFPASLESYTADAFKSCYRLGKITVAEGNNHYSSKDGVLFSKDMSVLYKFPMAKEDTVYTVPESVTEIGAYAFDHCNKMDSIFLPSKLETVGQDAFLACDSLIEMTFPSTLRYVGDRVFEYCSHLKRVEMPNELDFFGTWVYSDCWLLEEAPLPKGCVDMEGNFYGCALIKKVDVPETVTKLGYGSFCDCKSLESLTLPTTITTVGDYAFYGCKALTSIAIPEGVTTIGSYAFTRCSNLSKLTLPSTFTSIGKYALTFSSSISEIWNYAETPATCDALSFYGARSSAKLYVPEGSVATYKADTSWSYFDIQGFDAAAITTPVHGNNAVIARYGLNGQHVNGNQNGIQIVKYADGTTRKVAVGK